MMIKTHYAIIGFIAAVVFGIYVALAGMCSISPCETEIQITSYEIPDHVYESETARAEFTIKNKGDVMAQNCMLTWTLGTEKNSYFLPFQLAPSEEIDKEAFIIVPPRTGLEFGPTFTSSRAWVNCNNTESPKVLKSLIEIRSR